MFAYADLYPSPPSPSESGVSEADALATSALRALAEVTLDNAALQATLIEAGLPHLLQGLLSRGVGTGAESFGTVSGGNALMRSREVSRLLAALCLHNPSHSGLLASPLLPWLRRAAEADDSFLSSNASRALLHLAFPVGVRSKPEVAEYGFPAVFSQLR